VIPFRTPGEIAAAIPAAIRHLSRRGVIAYPTETIYGFGSTTDAVAVDRVAQLKGRAPGKPFLLLVTGREMVSRVGLRLPDAAERLAAAFWPGPLTLVLPGGEHFLPDVLRGPEGGVAVRWTSHPGAAKVVQMLGSPITSTSANRPRNPPAVDGAEVEELFGDEVKQGRLLVLDAGLLVPSPASTLVDCTGSAPRLVREGAVSAAALRSVVPSVVVE
jgi:L-threonylcarbamoyladenylate synthase